MTLYYHRFTGSLAAGDQFSYGWFANSDRSLSLAQINAVAWNLALWNGASAGNGYKDHVPAGCSMQNVTTTQIDQTTGHQLARVDTAQVIAGVAAGSALPADCALVVSLRTDLPRQTGRGRFYLPQPAASQTTATGRVLADLVADVISSLAAAWAGYNTASNRPVRYSRTFRTILNYVSFDVGDLYDTQRRRENKVTEVRTTNPMP